VTQRVTRTRIAILGGGLGAMTAAFHLTSAPDWRDRYDVTVYQLGWRLGGKAASGRNRARADRIEEHGLHLFFGFYDNAFALMQRLYGELARPADAPLARWDQAWQPHSYFVLEDEVAGRQVPWQFEFPPTDGVPGQGDPLPTPWQILQLLLRWGRELFARSHAAPAAGTVAPDRLDRIVARVAGELNVFAARGEAVVGGVLRRVHAAVDWIADATDALLPSAFLHAAERHAAGQPDDPGAHRGRDHDILLWLLRGFRDWLRRHFAERARTDTEIRRTLVSLDALIAVAVGMIEDDLITPPVDWFKIDGLRFEDWLVRHGADRASVEAPPVALLRDLVFGRQTGVGAGTCLHYALRMVYTYKGAFAYKMLSGSGDTIFAPFYQVLSARGVRFEFFQSVEELVPGRDADGRPVIDAIRIAVQAEVQGGAPYRPLVDVGGLPCWPSEPLYDQLVQGDALQKSGENLENWWNRWPAVGRRELRRGADFDQVVLGISIGAYPYICRQLIDETPKFARMVDQLQVTDTQAAQLWLDRDMAALGWSLGPQPIIGTCGEPFDTVADMSHVLRRERWRAGTAGSALYLTSQLAADGPDTPGAARAPTPPRTEWRYPLDQRARVWADLNRWADARAAGVIPRATSGGFQWDRLVDPDGATGRDRLAAQHWIACWNPSDRYVLSAPGTVTARLPSAGAGYANLVMAGDWTRTALNAGCAEAAVMSGMHAARALCGAPARITGDDLPDGDDVPPRGPPRGRYIELDGNDTPRLPYTARNVTMYSFTLEADVARLQAICDHELNLGGPVEYRPLGPFVFFVAATMSPIWPASPAAWTDEKDFGFWLPLVAGRRGADGAFHAERPVFYIPYLWVDSQLAAQAGREVFGYPKAVGRLANPSSPDDAAEFSIDALVVPALGPPGEPGSRWQWRRLVTASRRDAGRWGTLVGELGSIVELGRAVTSAITDRLGSHALPAPSLALLASLGRDALALDVPMVFLKQFRDAADPTAACYQAIVEAPNRMTRDPVSAGFLHGEWELAIEQFPIVRLIDRLGLRVQGDGKLTALLHIWVKFGFTAEPGQVIWRAV
jgi:uncharacterized protein with NAD-binding domain and iron-sulfur cluster